MAFGALECGVVVAFGALALHFWPVSSSSWGSSWAAYTSQWPLSPEGTSRDQVTGQSTFSRKEVTMFFYTERIARRLLRD